MERVLGGGASAPYSCTRQRDGWSKRTRGVTGARRHSRPAHLHVEREEAHVDALEALPEEDDALAVRIRRRIRLRAGAREAGRGGA